MIDSIRKSDNPIPMDFLCEYFDVSRSGYYNWRDRHKLVRFVRKQEICEAIKREFALSGESYGSPRMTKVLNSQ